MLYPLHKWNKASLTDVYVSNSFSKEPVQNWIVYKHLRVVIEVEEDLVDLARGVKGREFEPHVRGTFLHQKAIDLLHIYM